MISLQYRGYFKYLKILGILFVAALLAWSIFGPDSVSRISVDENPQITDEAIVLDEEDETHI